MTKLAIYTRVSTTSQEEQGTSLETQQEKGFQKAIELGLEPVLFNEGSASSSKDDLTNRPVLMDLLAKIDDGEFKDLFVWNTDRLSRSEQTWSMIKIQLLKNKVKLFTSSGEYDLDDPMSKMLLSLMSSVAVYDNELRTQRFRDGKLKRVKEGGWMGGPPPFGYKLVDSKLVIDEIESGWVKFIFNSFNEGNSAERISEQLLTAGVRTRRNNAVWARGSIEKLLNNTHYVGSYTFTDSRSSETVNIECPSIVDSETWIKSREMLRKRSHSSPKSVSKSNQKHPYLLLHLLHCGHCGSTMSGQRKTTQRSYYSCLKKTGQKYYYKNDENFIPCSTPRNLRMDLTDDTVFETILHTIEISHVFRESIKQSLHSSADSHISKDERRSRLNKSIQENNNQIERIKQNLDQYLKNSLLESYDQQEMKTFIRDVETKKQEIMLKTLDLEKELETLNSNKQWFGWFDHFESHIEHLRHPDTPVQEKHEFLLDVVDSITATSQGKTTTHFQVRFKLPVFGDELEWNDPKDKSLGYRLTSGSTNMSFEAETQKSVGRKSAKKD